MKIIEAEFLYGAVKLEQLPSSDLPEVAVVGRSNAGKSSLINRMTGRKKLARTSSTPGRTQELNFFRIKARRSEGDVDLILVDLPGFGYARFSKAQREELSRATVDYLLQRDALRMVCLLNDSRRKPGREEHAIQKLLFDREVPLTVIATKIDRFNQKERSRCLKSLAAGYGLEPGDLALAGLKTDPAGLWRRIETVLDLNDPGSQ